MDDIFDDDGDRPRNLSPGELAIWEMRRNGEDVVDRWGRPRIPLGTGPQSRLVEGIHRVRARHAPVVSDFIGDKEYLSLYEAVAAANWWGRVLNVFMTVSWEFDGEKPPSLIDWRHKNFVEKMRTWFADLPGRKIAPESRHDFACVWVKEVGKSLGTHSHFLVWIHPPFQRAFLNWARKAAHKTADVGPPDRRMVQTKRLWHASVATDDADVQWRRFRYLMKGMDEYDPLSLALLGGQADFYAREFSSRPTPQGRIVGRRSGFSRLLGPGNRAAWQRQGVMPVFCSHPDHVAEMPFGDVWLRQGEMARSLAKLNV